MRRHALLLSALALAALAACAPAREAGIADPDVFAATATETVVASARPAAEVAACFERRAALLPMSAFAADPATGAATYRLRGFGRTFEEIEFRPAPSGSTAAVRIAPNLGARWRAGFERDRGATLAACASGAAA